MPGCQGGKSGSFSGHVACKDSVILVYFLICVGFCIVPIHGDNGGRGSQDSLVFTDGDGDCSHSGDYIVLHVEVGAGEDGSSHFIDNQD